MILANKKHTKGDTRLWYVDYKDFLGEGVTLTAATVTSSSVTATVTGAALYTNKTRIQFFLNGGALNETATITVQVTDSTGQITNDTILFTVVAP